jgi:hypothetical protein
MELLFSEYIKLRKELENNGGVNAILENPGSELKGIYEKCLAIEDEILTKFGLPKSIRYREIIWELTSKSHSEQVINKLTNAAEEWLISSPQLSIELLEKAKKADLRSYEVLPEIGIGDGYHTIFYYEEYFKKGIISAQELLDILQSIDEETTVKIWNLNYYNQNKTNMVEAKLIFNELSEKQIPYLEKLKIWALEYPY